jgi:hypothetical protein
MGGYREERFDEAIRQFRTLLESNPLSPYGDESRYWIGCGLISGKKNSMRPLKNSSLARVPAKPLCAFPLLKIGDGYYNLKRYAKRPILFPRRELIPNPRSPEADYGILLCLLQERKYDSFISQVETFETISQHALAAQALMQLGIPTNKTDERECSKDLPRAHPSLSQQRVGGGSTVPYRLLYAKDGMGGSH